MESGHLRKFSRMRVKSTPGKISIINERNVRMTLMPPNDLDFPTSESTGVIY